LTLVANAGVDIGLIFLIIEIRQNTDQMRAQMAQSRADNRLSVYRDQVHSDYWPAISVKRAEAISTADWIASLTPDEYQRVRSHTLYEINDLRIQYLQYKNGYLDEALFGTSARDQIRRLMVTLEFFPDLNISSDDFVEYLNSVATEYDLPQYKRPE